ncbi:adenylate/guanylate cyclase domain-containing protein [Treponema sp.]|uniref:adenylate/guanylate cyclase domain-containing protein n=1 Tax=Treponema sp. TaxID=166 RepID=UPI00298E159A|nr:adenylate/guanylate cyclase domain-containing protein [Treponema sp.]MCQ2241705.1 adenylate/guanylate cyclase domain-containing protein [Treponema sp.]
MLEVSAVIYLGAPIVHLTYDGVPGNLVRFFLLFSKSVDYLAPLFMLFSFNIYLRDLLSHKTDGVKRNALLLLSAEIVLLFGLILFIVARFSDWYFFYDELNHYHRAKGRVFATIIPAVCMILQIALISANYKNISKRVRFSLVLFLVIPILSSVLSLMTHGFYLSNLSTVFMAIVLYIFVVLDSNEAIEYAHKREVEILENYKRELEITVDERTKELRIANEKAEHLLLNILPESIARELTEHPDKTISQTYPNATILFTDIVGFTKMSSEMSAEQTVSMLNELVSLFDRRAKNEGIEKIKTIGDAYMAATGLTTESNSDGALKMIHFAQGLLSDVQQFNKKSPVQIKIRIGINSGNLVAGVIGKTKFIYDVWGDTVNVASRMESTGEPMQIHVSENTWLQTKDAVQYENPVLVEIKGKGKMNCYFMKM